MHSVDSDQLPMKGCHQITLVCQGVKSIWNLLSAQEVQRGQQIRLHHWGLSFLLHHWDQEDLGAQQSPVFGKKSKREVNRKNHFYVKSDKVITF